MEFHFYKDSFDMYHKYKSFHEMISLDDTILHWECNISHASVIQHCVDAGFDDAQCKYNKVPLLLVEGNSQPCQIFFSFRSSSILIFL